MKRIIYQYRMPILFGFSLVLFLSGLSIIENIISNVNQEMQEPTPTVVQEEVTSTNAKEESITTTTPVQEVLGYPYLEPIDIVRHYYEVDATDEIKTQSMDYFEGVYRPSLGIDFSNGDEPFEVIASISGTVQDVKEDPVFGGCLSIVGENGIVVTYQSLDDIAVSEGDTIAQSEYIGMSGTNIYESDLKKHIHFVVEKNGKTVNPEDFFEISLSEIS